ncbi:MAG: Asp-tRNA(Asn)/Glu-tRNA(Gln) amidotransferase subunit GatC [Tissierellaceae bacterium]
MISREDILHMAELAKLSISDDEMDRYVDNLNKMIEVVDKIKELDTDNSEPNYNVNNLINPLREDEIKESLPSEEVLKNTTEEQYGYFKILRVVD